MNWNFLFIWLISNYIGINASNWIVDQDPCLAKAQEGHCTPSIKTNSSEAAILTRFTFDMSIGACVHTKYMGCNGGMNLFDDVRICSTTCYRRAYFGSCDQTRCQDPLTTGCIEHPTNTPSNMKNMKERYYFSKKLGGKCVKFYGNLSDRQDKCDRLHFLTKENCESTCRCPQLLETVLQNRCLARPVWRHPDNEICDSSKKIITMWSYSTEHGRCISSKICENSEAALASKFQGNGFWSRNQCEMMCAITNAKDVCKLPKDPGVGKYNLFRYYWDFETNKCRLFAYRGSLGNYNRFRNRQECYDICGSWLPKDTYQAATLVMSKNRDTQLESSSKYAQFDKFLESDFCLDNNFWQNNSGSILRYSYNEQFNQCIPIMVSVTGRGSTTSRNVFTNLEICNDICTNRRQSKERPSNQPRCSHTNFLSQSTSQLQCTNKSYLWIADQSGSFCKPVEYCYQTNTVNQSKNNLENKPITNEQICKQLCLTKATKLKDLQDICSLPQITDNLNNNNEPCLEPIQERWSFDSQSKSCIKFIGCPSRLGNNFVNKEECLRHCFPLSNKDICSLPTDAGVCRNNQTNYTLYSYNPSLNKCSAFSYSGCHGNKNKFSTLKQCENLCLQISKNSAIVKSTFLMILLPIILYSLNI